MGEVVLFDESGQSIVQVLEEALAQAEAGKLTSLALVVALRDGDTAQVFCPGDGVVSVLGGLRIAEEKVLEYLKNVNEGEL